MKDEKNERNIVSRTEKSRNKEKIKRKEKNTEKKTKI